LVPKIESAGVLDAAIAGVVAKPDRRSIAPAMAARMTQLRRSRRMNGGQENIAALDPTFWIGPNFLQSTLGSAA
jgi:hypothetical protein